MATWAKRIFMWSGDAIYPKATLTGVAFTFLLTASCNSSSSLSERDRANVIADATETLQRYYEDIRKDGLMAELNYLDSSSEFFWVPPGYESALTYDSVVAILKQNAPGLASVENSFDTLTVNALSRELAVYTGRLRSVVVDTAGTSNEFTMIETGLLIRRASGWKLLCGQTTFLE